MKYLMQKGNRQITANNDEEMQTLAAKGYTELRRKNTDKSPRTPRNSGGMGGGAAAAETNAGEDDDE